jgi:hypothetical protein
LVESIPTAPRIYSAVKKKSSNLSRMLDFFYH